MLTLGASKIHETVIGNTYYAGELLGNLIFRDNSNRQKDEPEE